MHNQYHDQEPRQYPNQPASERYQPGDQRHHNMSYDMGRDEYDRPISGHAPPHAQSLPSYDQGERYRHGPEAQQFSPYEQGHRHENPHHHEEPQAQLHAGHHGGYHPRQGEDRGQHGGSRSQQHQHEQGDGQARDEPSGPLGREHPYGGYDRNEPHLTRYNPSYRPEYERGHDPRGTDMNEPDRADHHRPEQGHYHAAINRQPGYAGNFEAQQGHLANNRDMSHGQQPRFGPPDADQSYPEGSGPRRYHGDQGGPDYARAHNPYRQHRGPAGADPGHDQPQHPSQQGGHGNPATWEHAEEGRSRTTDRPDQNRRH